MKRWPLWTILISSIVGMVGSAIATYQYFQILKFGFENKSFCSINAFIDCDVAYASSHAQFFGVPLSWLGLLFYILMFGLAFWILWKGSSAPELASFGWLLSLGGVGMTIYKAYISFTVLKVLCLICATMYVVNLTLLFSWHSFLKIGLGNFSGLSFRPQWKSLGLLTFLLFGAGWFVIDNYQGNLLKRETLNISTEELLRFHFRQSEYQLEIDPELPVWGNPDAKVTVVEFSDFQCPYCRHAAFHLKPVLAEFKEKIRFYYYHYPIDQSCNENVTFPAHDKACMASQAAVCAQKKGDFWNFHDDIFRDQKKLSPEFLLGLAKKRGWDENEFQTCINAPETVAAVKKSITTATKIFVEGTPTVIVNNRRVKYWGDPEVFRAILKEEIKRQR